MAIATRWDSNTEPGSSRNRKQRGDRYVNSVCLPWNNLSTWHQVGLLPSCSTCEQRAPHMGNLLRLTEAPVALAHWYPVYVCHLAHHGQPLDLLIRGTDSVYPRSGSAWEGVMQWVGQWPTDLLGSHKTDRNEKSSIEREGEGQAPREYIKD